MALTNLTEMMKDALSQLNDTVGSTSIIGQAIETGSGMTIIPVSKLTVGFLTGGAEIDGLGEKLNDTNTPVGAIGGGVTVSPVGFLVVSNGAATVLKADGNNGVEKWLDIVGNTIKDLMQKD